jgi:hypothetical protein
MIGQPTASWSSSNTEENQAAELEVLAEGDKPTLLFMYVRFAQLEKVLICGGSTSKHHSALVSRLHESFSSHSFGAFAARHKLPSLRSGHVSRNGLWDKYVWSGIRESAFGGVAGEKLRGVIVVGGTSDTRTLGTS